MLNFFLYELQNFAFFILLGAIFINKVILVRQKEVFDMGYDLLSFVEPHVVINH